MHCRSLLICKLTVGTFLMLWAQTTAEMVRDNAALNTLYNNLLQREYAEPVVFPNHQVERKAQRSPSLRLRFGRRSDPDLIPHIAEKRWFDEVNQKPIRSPSLRLRFGRRSDPSMPLHSPIDMIMNEVYENQVEHALFDNFIEDNEAALPSDEDELYNNLAQSQRLRNILMLLNKYASKENDGLASRGEGGVTPSTMALEGDVDEFERGIRKPQRLRWGRSTGGVRLVAANGDKGKNDLEQKNKVTEISNEVEKTFNSQNKD